MSEDTTGRVEPLATSDDIDAYCQRLVRLTRVEAYAGSLLAISMDTERNSDGSAHESLAREYATQAIAIRYELAAWRAANPDPKGAW